MLRKELGRLSYREEGGSPRVVRVGTVNYVFSTEIRYACVKP